LSRNVSEVKFDLNLAVNIGDYPITEPGSDQYRSVVEEARVSLAKHGYAELSGFVSPHFVDWLTRDAEALAPSAYRSVGKGTAYLAAPDAGVEPGHPLRHMMPFGVRVVAYDAIPYKSPLRLLYESPELTAFIGAIVNRGELHPYGDPFGALNLAVMGEGDELQWHYDQTDFVVSLAIQTSESGGTFDVVPLMRTADDERFDLVKALFEGDESQVVTLPMTPGTLLVFEGRNSIHRVSPIRGEKLRHVGLLAYDTVPDRQGSGALRQTRYGRTEPLSTPPSLWSDQ